MKKFRKVFIFILVFAVMISMSSSAFAETLNVSIGSSTVKGAEKSEAVYTTQRVLESDYIEFYKPYNNQVFYRGEVISVHFDMWDIWISEYVYTLPYLSVLNSSYNELYWHDNDIVPRTEFPTCYFDNIPASRFPNGKYELNVLGIAADEYGIPDESFTQADCEEAALDFYVTTLLAPTSVKAKAGKKKVTVAFAKASGASKYTIYRSAKKTKGYKAIKTTTATKYVDKKVKKGKKYYYKVKSVRTVIGTVNSVYSKIVRSKKVK